MGFGALVEVRAGWMRFLGSEPQGSSRTCCQQRADLDLSFFIFFKASGLFSVLFTEGDVCEAASPGAVGGILALL